MWFDFDERAPVYLEVEEPRLALDAELIGRLEGMRTKQLRVVAEELTYARNALFAIAFEWGLTTSPEVERDYVERSFAGEVKLRNPPPDFDELMVGASLHAQVLRASARWSSELADAARQFVWQLIKDRKAAKAAARDRR